MVGTDGAAETRASVSPLTLQRHSLPWAFLPSFHSPGFSSWPVSSQLTSKIASTSQGLLFVQAGLSYLIHRYSCFAKYVLFMFHFLLIFNLHIQKRFYLSEYLIKFKSKGFF